MAPKKFNFSTTSFARVVERPPVPAAAPASAHIREVSPFRPSLVWDTPTPVEPVFVVEVPAFVSAAAPPSAHLGERAFDPTHPAPTPVLTPATSFARAAPATAPAAAPPNALLREVGSLSTHPAIDTHISGKRVFGVNRPNLANMGTIERIHNLLRGEFNKATAENFDRIKESVSSLVCAIIINPARAKDTRYREKAAELDAGVTSDQYFSPAEREIFIKQFALLAMQSALHNPCLAVNTYKIVQEVVKKIQFSRQDKSEIFFRFLDSKAEVAAELQTKMAEVERTGTYTDVEEAFADHPEVALKSYDVLINRTANNIVRSIVLDGIRKHEEYLPEEAKSMAKSQERDQLLDSYEQNAIRYYGAVVRAGKRPADAITFLSRMIWKSLYAVHYRDCSEEIYREHDLDVNNQKANDQCRDMSFLGSKRMPDPEETQPVGFRFKANYVVGACATLIETIQTINEIVGKAPIEQKLIINNLIACFCNVLKKFSESTGNSFVIDSRARLAAKDFIDVYNGNDTNGEIVSRYNGLDTAGISTTYTHAGSLVPGDSLCALFDILVEDIRGNPFNNVIGSNKKVIETVAKILITGNVNRFTVLKALHAHATACTSYADSMNLFYTIAGYIVTIEHIMEYLQQVDVTRNSRNNHMTEQIYNVFAMLPLLLQIVLKKDAEVFGKKVKITHFFTNYDEYTFERNNDKSIFATLNNAEAGLGDRFARFLTVSLIEGWNGNRELAMPSMLEGVAIPADELVERAFAVGAEPRLVIEAVGVKAIFSAVMKHTKAADKCAKYVKACAKADRETVVAELTKIAAAPSKFAAAKPCKEFAEKMLVELGVVPETSTNEIRDEESIVRPHVSTATRAVKKFFFTCSPVSERLSVSSMMDRVSQHQDPCKQMCAIFDILVEDMTDESFSGVIGSNKKVIEILAKNLITRNVNRFTVLKALHAHATACTSYADSMSLFYTMAGYIVTIEHIVEVAEQAEAGQRSETISAVFSLLPDLLIAIYRHSNQTVDAERQIERLITRHYEDLCEASPSISAPSLYAHLDKWQAPLGTRLSTRIVHGICEQTVDEKELSLCMEW